MGDFRAGKWIIILVIYFTFFILIANASANVGAEVELDTTELTIDIVSADHLCNSPRYRFNPTTGEYKEFTGGFLALLDCEHSLGAQGSIYCNNIKGCNWTNITGKRWWSIIPFVNGTYIQEQCFGFINATYYGVNTTNSSWTGLPQVAKFDPLGYWDDNDETSANVCRHPAVITDEEVCTNVFSCKWDTFDISEKYSSARSIYNTISDVFSFRYDFGLGDSATSYFLRFMFIVIPLIILIIMIYFALPFVN